MARICPCCTTPMKIETVHGVTLDICTQCAGIWFDPEELRTLQMRDPLSFSMLEDKVLPTVEKRTDASAIRHCPDCSLPLQQHRYLYNSPILLDSCTDCGGVWVEDGELEKMQQWLEKSHEPATGKEGVKVALAESTLAHDSEMRRQNKFQQFFTALRQFRPGGLA